MIQILRIACARRALAPGRVLAPLLSLASACAAPHADANRSELPPPSGAAPESSAALELGSGEVAFEPAENGDHLTLYAGTQGGHHVWLSVRVRGFASDEVRMILDVIPAEPAPPAHTDVRLYFAPVPGDEGLREFVGFPARVLEPACAAGKPVRLAVKLEDGQQMVSGELEVVADAPTLGFTSECSL